jgi:hypothetical protein
VSEVSISVALEYERENASWVARQQWPRRAVDCFWANGRQLGTWSRKGVLQNRSRLAALSLPMIEQGQSEKLQQQSHTYQLSTLSCNGLPAVALSAPIFKTFCQPLGRASDAVSYR